MRKRTNGCDTYNLASLIFSGYANYGDEEVRMRKLETQMSTDMYNVNLDWSNPGCQHKSPFGP